MIYENDMWDYANKIDDISILLGTYNDYQCVNINFLHELILSFRYIHGIYMLVNIDGEDETGRLDLDKNEQLIIIGIDII